MSKVTKPKVVCLCGSTRFKDAFIQANRNETLKGNIVLSVGMFGHQEGIDMEGQVKKDLDQLHLRKIDMADEILVLNVGKYVGQSTRNEIRYAKICGKPVRYLEDPEDNDWVKSLEDLHAKFGNKAHLVTQMPVDVRKAYYRFRLDFLQEELDELKVAKDAADVTDALIDLCVVAIGTLHAFGVDARKAWNKVHQANMAKQPGANPNRPNPFGLPDLIKPEGWQAPDHSDNTGIFNTVL